MFFGQLIILELTNVNTGTKYCSVPAIHRYVSFNINPFPKFKSDAMKKIPKCNQMISLLYFSLI